jgi:hypothetical protein
MNNRYSSREARLSFRLLNCRPGDRVGVALWVGAVVAVGSVFAGFVCLVAFLLAAGVESDPGDLPALRAAVTAFAVAAVAGVAVQVGFRIERRARTASLQTAQRSSRATARHPNEQTVLAPPH